MAPIKIAIVGNISAGKSTIMNRLTEAGSVCFKEGISDWGNLLELSYANPHRYSLLFQLRIVSEQTLQSRNIDSMSDKIVYTERCSDDGLHAFMKAKQAQGYIDEHEIKEFQRWFTVLNLGLIPDLVIYLKTDPNVVFERLQRRKQVGDDFIDLEYLQLLHDLYEKRYNPDIEGDKFPDSDSVLILENLSIDATLEKILAWVENKTS